jgi:hypothetical protein
MAKPKREQLTQDRQIRALKAEGDAFEHAIKETPEDCDQSRAQRPEKLVLPISAP